MSTNITKSNETDCDEKARRLYGHISERLCFNDQPIEIVDETKVEPQQVESAVLANRLYFKLGSLLEELAYQCADRSETNTSYRLALDEIGLMSEFVVQIAERNPGVNILNDRASEELYKKRRDYARFWVGDFEYQGERVDFFIMVRPKPHEVADDAKPGKYSESRQARLSIGLKTSKYNIAIRMDPERTICMDIEAPALSTLSFENVGQSGAHHFYTDVKPSNSEFEGMLNIYSTVFDSMINRVD